MWRGIDESAAHDFDEGEKLCIVHARTSQAQLLHMFASRRQHVHERQHAASPKIQIAAVPHATRGQTLLEHMMQHAIRSHTVRGTTLEIILCWVKVQFHECARSRGAENRRDARSHAAR